MKLSRHKATVYYPLPPLNLWRGQRKEKEPQLFFLPMLVNQLSIMISIGCYILGLLMTKWKKFSYEPFRPLDSLTLEVATLEDS